MKRNYDLIRDILLFMESDQFYSGKELEISGYSEEEIDYQVNLLKREGMIEALDIATIHDSGPRWQPVDITWAGHDFLEAARDNGIWEQTKNKVLKSGKDIGFSLLKEVLKDQMRNSLGMG